MTFFEEARDAVGVCVRRFGREPTHLFVPSSRAAEKISFPHPVLGLVQVELLLLQEFLSLPVVLTSKVDKVTAGLLP